MSKANQKIREAAKEKSVALWRIAEKLGINVGNVSRKLRRELADEEQQRILNIIDELADEKEPA